MRRIVDTPTTLTLDTVWQALIGGEPPETLGRGHALTDVVIDSRAAAASSLFVALQGERVDGHIYLANAFERGAVAALAEPRAQELYPHARFILPDGELREPAGTPAGEGAAAPPVIFIAPDSLAALQRLASYWRNSMPAVAVAITGSIGKTTTKEIVANVLAQRFNTLRSEGNLNNEIGLPLTLLRLRPEHERMVLEMGMYTLGEITRLCEMARPTIGIVTNVGPSHLERLGSIERISQAKSELPASLPPAEEGGVALLNADDPLVRMMAGLTQARVFTYGLNPESNLWADEIESQGLEGIKFRFHYGAAGHGADVLHVRLPLLGRHSVHSALRGAAAGLVSGLSWEEIVAGLQEVRGQLRLVVARGLRDTTLIDDTYNASPDSMLAALNLLEEIKNSSHRAIAVLGDMYELGAYEEAGHRLVGGRASQVVSKLITVGPRARLIAEEALALGMPVADVHPVENNNDAIAVLQGVVRPGDVVLVKGSRAAGMEMIVDALSRPRAAGGQP
jgi:UDP-N-acetylmuramoyl-tripeptide--D-alanyl-D-alanine ligase